MTNTYSINDETIYEVAQVIHDNLCGCGEEYVECDGDLYDGNATLTAARAVLSALMTKPTA